MSLLVLFVVGCDAPSGDPPPDDEACEVPGNVCTWLGIPGQTFFSGEGTDRSQDVATGTLLSRPVDITFGADGTAYYPDFNNQRIRKVSSDGIVTTVSGTGVIGDGQKPSDGSAANCWDGCEALFSLWHHPTHIAIDPTDTSTIYVSAWHNSRINVIDTVTGTLHWFAGTARRFYGEGLDPATAAHPPEEQLYALRYAILDLPSSIAFGPDGTMYFSDQSNHMIRKITPGSTRVEIVAGQIEPSVHPTTQLPTYLREPGYEGDGGDALLAKLHGHNVDHPDPGSKIVADLPNHRLVIADSLNGVIRTYDLDTGIIDTIAGKYASSGEVTVPDLFTGIPTTSDAGSVPGYAGDGGDALEAVFHTPGDVAIGLDGEIYVADTKNHCVRVLRDGIVDRFAGICGGEMAYSGDGGPALEAEFSDVYGVEVDADGNVYIADLSNQIIRRVWRGSP
jgi:hypothetical protein